MATLLDIVKKGSTDRSVCLRIIDSGDGTPETGVVYNTSGIDLWYRREGAAVTSITEATLAALTTAHTDGGFLHVSHGEYRLDLPDAAFATGANYVDIGGTVTGMIVIGGRVRLVDYDPEDTVRLGLTALPNAAAAASGGLFTRGTGAGQINQDANGRIDVNVAAISADSAAADNLESYTDGTTPMPVNATQISGDATAADNAEAFFDGTGYAGTNNVIPTVTTVGTLTTYTGNTPQTGDAYAVVNSGTHGNAAINTKIGTPSDLGSGATLAFNISDVHNHTTDIVDATTIFSGTADSGSTTTLVDAALTQSDADYWVGNWVKFTSGNLIGQVRLITDFVPGTDTVTFAPATTQAVSTHGYVIIPAALITADLTHIAGDLVDTAVAQLGVNTVQAGGTAWGSGAITAGSIASDAITAAKIAAGAIDAATFAADVDAEILSYLVDDATRIDASALNTASVTTIPAILDDTDLIDDGTSGLAKIATDVAAILVDTAVIGALGAGLTAIIGADGDTLKTLSDQIDGLSTSAAPQLLQNTTIATLATQTSFTLTAGSADNDAYNGAIIVVTDQSTATQKAVGLISDYVGASKTITLSSDPAIFTMAVGDTVDILAAIGSAPTVAQIRAEMDSNSTQLAAIVADTNELQTDWANGGRLDLLLDATLADTNELQTDWANGGRLDLIVDAILLDTAEIGAAGAGLTAIQLPSNGLANVTAWTVAITGNITGNLSGSVGSVTGAVGSVTGNVGGNVTGSVGSVLGGINTTAGVITTLDGLDTAQDAKHDATKADTAAILLDTGTDGVVVAAGSKTGYSLAATGLDSITATDPGGVASTFPQMLVQLWRRFFKKVTRDSDEIKTYADNGSTVRTTQTYTASGSDEDVGAAV